MQVTIRPKPYVGALGTGNTLEVVDLDDRLICRVTRGSFLFQQTIVFLFGVALTGGIWLGIHNPKEKTPLVFAILVWILMIVCWTTFVRNLFGTPRAEIMRAGGEIRLYRFRTSQPSQVILPGQIERLMIEREFYVYKNSQTENFVLTLALHDGERLPLCVSTDAGIIKTAGERIAAITGRKMEAP